LIVIPVDGRFDFPEDVPFDVPALLAAPRVARLATTGPTVRPVWFLWEDNAFWVFIGTWSTLDRRLARDPAFELVVDICELDTGLVRQVVARGKGEVLPLDAPRARRKLVRYLGPDEQRWDPRFSLHGDVVTRGLRWARLTPERMIVKDLSFRPASSDGRVS
jgi:hypothetical protein